MNVARTSPRTMTTALLTAVALAVTAWLVATGASGLAHSMATNSWHKVGDPVATNSWHKAGDVLATNSWHSVQP
ncbi:MAG: hypothetical protein ACXV2J_15430 [Actinomycetes bacterium]